MRKETFEFKASDQKTLFVYAFRPGEGAAVRGVVQIAHGMAEHAGRYERLANALCGAGYAVFAADHRGHGKTCQDENELGFFASNDGWNRVLSDQEELSAKIQGEYPRLALVMFGHSMGATMVETLMYRNPELYAGVVLSGSSGKPSVLASAGRYIAKAEKKRLGEKGKSSLIQKLTFEAFNKPFEPARTPFEWLSRDPHEVDVYKSDSRCGFMCTTSLWVDLLDGLAEIAKKQNISRIRKDLPIYVMAGTQDPVSENTKLLRQLVETYYSVGLNQLTVHYYEGARHELINEINRDQIISDLIAWLDGHIGR